MACITVGVLCLQGDFLEHIKKLNEIRELKAKDNIVLVVREIRKAEELDSLDGLIVPGGETTTLNVLLSRDGFQEKFKTWLSKKPAVWGTCAGTILFADEVKNQRSGGQRTIGGIAIEVTRNQYGRQLQSFEANVVITEPPLQTVMDKMDSPSSLGVFIRAPGISQVLSPEVKVLGRLSSDNTVVAVQQGNIMATCFHPELTDDLRWHIYFVDIVVSAKI